MSVSEDLAGRMLNIDINISILLKEYPFLERFARAAGLGFEAVEFYWGPDLVPAEVAQRVIDAGLKVPAFNLDAGDMAAGDRGLLNDPDRKDQVRQNLDVAFDLAHRIGCKKLTALPGNYLPGEERERQLGRMRENFKWICEEAQAEGLTILTEAINGFDNPAYPFTTTEETISFIESVDADNFAYLYDIYHMQRMEGNITATLEKYAEKIGHIQIADCPGRHFPGSGEINFRRVFETVEESGYKGYIGLEYIAEESTEDSLAWLPLTLRRGIYLDSLYS